MKLNALLQEPHKIGWALFALSASFLLAVIVAGSLGMTSLAMMLSQIAQPICASAIGVLVYLAMVARRHEKTSLEGS
ncbi:MAG TPA: hypothetical protein VF272_03490 [Candidatus Saccharimonadia bacterium]